jgi:endogenous inhibitor of DNA gyrase (YacG/DUF329 family)
MPKDTCAVTDCAKLAATRGWCCTHYNRWRKTGTTDKRCAGCGLDLGTGFTGQGKYHPDCRPQCAAPDCDRPIRGQGPYCIPHTQQMLRKGTVGPLSYAAEWVCIVCGVDVERGSGRRRHCSSRCQVIHSRTKGNRPRYNECRRCGDLIDLLSKTPAGQFKRSDAKICDPCRRARYTRHKVSVSVIAKRSGTDCGICGEQIDMTLRAPDLWRASVDHVVPYAHGGSHDIENLQLAHLWCNQVKHDRAGFTI